MPAQQQWRVSACATVAYPKAAHLPRVRQREAAGVEHRLRQRHHGAMRAARRSHRARRVKSKECFTDEIVSPVRRLYRLNRSGSSERALSLGFFTGHSSVIDPRLDLRASDRASSSSRDIDRLRCRPYATRGVEGSCVIASSSPLAVAPYWRDLSAPVLKIFVDSSALIREHE